MTNRTEEIMKRFEKRFPKPDSKNYSDRSEYLARIRDYMLISQGYLAASLERIEEKSWHGKPNKAGAYFVRGFDDAMTLGFVMVAQDNDGLVCNMHGSSTESIEQVAYLISSISDPF